MKKTFSLSFLEGLLWACDVWNSLQIYCYNGGKPKAREWKGEYVVLRSLRMKPKHGRQSKDMEKIQVLDESFQALD